MATARRSYRRLPLCGLHVLRTGFLALLVSVTSAIDFPPSFIEQPNELIVYRPGATVSLPCVASGDPPPSYRWKRNMAIHTWNGNWKANSRIRVVNGSVTIKAPLESEDGWYQCIAHNRHGTALSHMVRLQRAYIRNLKAAKREVEGEIGRPLTVPCTRPDSFPAAAVQWLFGLAGSGGFPTPQQFVEESPRLAMDLNGNLLFSAVQRDDGEKVFTCSATNRFLRFTVHGEDVRLKLLPPPKDQPPTRPVRLMYHSDSHVVALANQTVRIRCFFAGAPTPSITWTKDGIERLPDGARVLAKGVELIFIRFQRHHVGDYACRGHNSVNRIGETADFQIRMQSRPSWVKKPLDRLLPANTSHEFVCDARGDPRPNLVWSVNGIHINKYIDNNKFFTGGKKLILNDLKVSDTSVIQCNASNVHGSIFVNAYINVLRHPPEFRRKPQLRLKSPEGRRTMLTCETYSAPEANVTWYFKRRKLISRNFPHPRMRLTRKGNLVIERAQPSDSGLYTCEARNWFGVVKAAGHLRITEATTITTPLKSLVILEDQEARFLCRATTEILEIINLTINWYKDGRPIKFGVNPRYRRVKGNGETLVIHRARPSDSGRYECMATNRLDEDWSNATLLVQGRPQAPTNLVVDCRSRRSRKRALLRWQPGADNNAPIKRYDVQFALVRRNATKETQKAQWFAAEVDNDSALSSTPPHNQTEVKLRPWLNYTFRVSAHNKVGASPPSAATRVHCGLPPAPPSENPRDLRVSGLKPKELAVNWTPMSPLDQNGPGLVYQLTVACLTCDNMPSTLINKTTVKDWRQDHLVFRYLLINGQRHRIETYKQYRVAIKSENELGESTASASEVKGYSGEDRPLTRPTELRVVENADPKSHLVRLIWKRPADLSEKAVRGRFRGYRVRWCHVKMSARQCEREMQYKDILNDDVTQREKAPPGYISVTLRSLPGLVKLKIWVCVINTHYCGQASNTVQVETREGVPGPVSEFNMVSMGTTHLDFEWAKPLQVNGRLVGYQLGILKMDDVKDEGIIKKFPPIQDREQLSDRIIGLLPNTNYRVYIWARTRQGNGLPTHLDVRTANVNEQSKPKFRVHSVTGSSLNVSLLPQVFDSLSTQTTDPSQQKYEFYVEYQKMGSITWEQTRTEYGPRRWMLLTGLDSDTTYFLRVVGGPDAVQSRSSDSVQVRTEELSGVESLFASGLIWLVVLGCAVLCLGVFLVGLCYFRHKRLKYARGKPLPTQESAEKALEQNDYTMPEQITRLPGSGTLQRPMRDFNNHHDTLYMTKLGSSCQEDPNEMATVNGRGNGYGYTSLTKSPVNTIPTSFV